jgi:hypothetical protein
MRIAAFFLVVALFVVGVTTTRISMPASAADCDPNYIGACVPNNATGGVTCDTIKAMVTVANVDVYKLDKDGDGTACESYAKQGTKTTSTNGAAASSSNGANPSCSTIFVAGKGVVDSCSNGHKDTARIYPRKAGIPANGCTDACPEVTDAAKTTTTPGPADKVTPRAAGPSNFATPVPSDFTPPADRPTEAPQNCDRVSYPDICVPAAPPYLSCSDIPDRNFRVRAPDPHRFDADGNGIGCEQVAGPTIGR